MKDRIGAFINAYVHYRIEDALEGIANAGFKNVELLSTPGLAKDLIPDPEYITDKEIHYYLTLCRKFELSINGVYYYKGGSTIFDCDKAVGKLKKMVDMAVKLESRFAVTDTDEVDSIDKEKKFYRYIEETCDYAQSYGVEVCLDIHGNWCGSGKRAAEILEKVGHPRLGINYCTGNVIYYDGVRPEEDIKYALPFMRRIHIKDSSGVRKKYDFPALGEGSVNFMKIFNSLKGFQGPINAEVDFGNEIKPLKEINEALQRSFAFINRSEFET